MGAGEAVRRSCPRWAGSAAAPRHGPAGRRDAVAKRRQVGEAEPPALGAVGHLDGDAGGADPLEQGSRKNLVCQAASGRSVVALNRPSSTAARTVATQ